MMLQVDTAFMSTSKNEHTPIQVRPALAGPLIRANSHPLPSQYMGPDANVLWELQTQAESDSGFHRGADISLLSYAPACVPCCPRPSRLTCRPGGRQFSGEDEVLFPPCTMLRVIGEDKKSARTRSPSTRVASDDISDRFQQQSVGNKKFIAISVLPCFL